MFNAKDIEILRSRHISQDLVWWGWRQSYKWRWNLTHIDLGPISVYNLRRLWFWRGVAVLIWLRSPLLRPQLRPSGSGCGLGMNG